MFRVKYSQKLLNLGTSCFSCYLKPKTTLQVIGEQDHIQHISLKHRLWVEGGRHEIQENIILGSFIFRIFTVKFLFVGAVLWFIALRSIRVILEDTAGAAELVKTDSFTAGSIAQRKRDGTVEEILCMCA